jgi:crossover junction endodeoxyribonuclease RuvC
VLGIDPGVASTGIAVVSERDGEYRSIAYQCVRTSPKDAFPRRLALLHGECAIAIKKYRPDSVAMERLFFARNAKTAIAVGQAQGVLLLAAASDGLDVTFYTPMEVKSATTGDGSSDKAGVALMIQKILGLAEIPRPDDAADALAIAYCHLVSTRGKGGTNA